jgi:acrylyl-CoA reductase (NADPH)
MTFNALWISQDTAAVELRQIDDAELMAGDVTVDVEYSSVNFKDAVALSHLTVPGMAPIVRRFPMIPGIDLAGIVSASDHPEFVAGERVLINGWGLSETHFGGYAQRACVRGQWLVKVPEVFSTRDAMAIGTAGYTAMLSVLALEKGGITPDRGEVLVTGASGGVGSIAVALLSQLGYHVVASTGKLDERAYLQRLGASTVIDRRTLSEPGKPVGQVKWAGAIDLVGGHTLANVIAQTDYRGVVACCGLAQSADLPSSVLPFILRHLTLAGIDSVNASQHARIEAWERLERDLDRGKLAQTETLIGLAEVPAVARNILQGQVRGRTVVDVNR